MNFFELPEKILRYTDEHTTDEDAVLQELYRTTHLKTIHPQMLSGKVQGQFLTMISQMIRPANILEIGTFTGYSAYCLSKGLAKNGIITTIEVDEELESMVSGFFHKAGIADKVNFIVGDALKVLPSLQEHYDLVFIDANKEHYVEYYNLIIDKVNSGGYIVADNVLWSGKVAEDPEQDNSTKILHQFNELVTKDPRVENVLLTVRDGLMVTRKC